MDAGFQQWCWTWIHSSGRTSISSWPQGSTTAILTSGFGRSYCHQGNHFKVGEMIARKRPMTYTTITARMNGCAHIQDLPEIRNLITVELISVPIIKGCNKSTCIATLADLPLGGTQLLSQAWPSAQPRQQSVPKPPKSTIHVANRACGAKSQPKTKILVKVERRVSRPAS